MTLSNGNIFRVTGHLCGVFSVKRPVTRNFVLRLNERLSKQSSGWWFETLSCPLWRHCNGIEWWITALDTYSRFNWSWTRNAHCILLILTCLHKWEVDNEIKKSNIQKSDVRSHFSDLTCTKKCYAVHVQDWLHVPALFIDNCLV